MNYIHYESQSQRTTLAKDLDAGAITAAAAIRPALLIVFDTAFNTIAIFAQQQLTTSLYLSLCVSLRPSTCQ